MHAHDTFAARLLGRRENARDVLRWSLPPALAHRLDWRTLQAVPANSRQSDERRGDLAFRIRTLGGSLLGIHVVVEHQRIAERRMPFRVLEYEARAWMAQLEDGGEVTRVLAIVLYNGASAWPYSTSIEGLMPDDGLEGVMGDLQLRGSFLLIDLSETSDQDLTAAALGAHTRLGLWLLKNAPQLPRAEFWRTFGMWLGCLADVYTLPDGPSRLRAVLDYVGFVVGEPSENDLQTIASALPERATETVMTWAQALTEKGIEKGIEQGQRRTLLRQLTQRFGDLPSRTAQRIQQAPSEQLVDWLDRVLEATSLEDVLDH